MNTFRSISVSILVADCGEVEILCVQFRYRFNKFRGKHVRDDEDEYTRRLAWGTLINYVFYCASKCESYEKSVYL